MSVPYNEMNEMIDLDASRIQKSGFFGYTNFLDYFKNSISPAESILAESQFVISRKWFILCIALTLGISPLSGFEIDSSFMKFWSSVFPFISSLILISCFGITFAGRTLMTLSALLPQTNTMGSWEIGIEVEENLYQLIFYIFSQFLLGFLLDKNATINNENSLSANNKNYLRVAGICLFLIYTYSTFGLEVSNRNQTLSFEYITPLILFAWPSLISRNLIKPQYKIQGDPLLIYKASLTRWKFYIFGKLLSLLFLSAIFVILLNSLSIRSTLDRTSPDQPISAYLTDHVTKPNIFLSYVKGDLLRLGDLQSEKKLIFQSQPDTLFDDSLISLIPDYDSSPERMLFSYALLDENAYEKFSTQALRVISTLEQLDSAIRSIQSEHLWLLSEKSNDRDSTIWVLEPLHRTLLTTTSQKLMSYLDATLAQSVLGLVLALLSFIFLWERGGDSKSGFWIGIWFAGTAFFCVMGPASLNGVQIENNLALLSRSSLFGVALSYYWHILIGISQVAAAIYLNGLLGWILYYTLRISPNVQNLSHVKKRQKFIEYAIFPWAAIFIGVVLINNYFPRLEPLLTSPLILITLEALGIVPFHFITKNKFTDTKYETLEMGQYGCLIALLATTLLIGVITSDQLYDSNLIFQKYAPFWLYIMAAGLVLVLGSYYIFKNTHFQSSSVKDISFLGTSIVLPIVFQFVENLTVDATRELGFFTQQGGQMAGILAVVLLLQPLLRLFENFFSRLSDPLHSKTSQKADILLEASISSNNTSDIESLIDKLLIDLNLREYVLFSRVEENSFTSSINKTNSDYSPIELSSQMIKMLRNHKKGVRLNNFHMEWKFFFLQFELARARDLLGYGFIVPLCLGNSLRGFLFVPDKVAEDKSSKTNSAQLINDLGVLTTNIKK